MRVGGGKGQGACWLGVGGYLCVEEELQALNGGVQEGLSRDEAWHVHTAVLRGHGVGRRQQETVQTAHWLHIVETGQDRDEQLAQMGKGWS